ncbi:MAG TPA: type II CAAX endopeptidase family protein [Anaerolineales bacterium]|nr:type II CAAX endopeptidase family protein [Anaerolineales bacterium]
MDDRFKPVETSRSLIRNVFGIGLRLFAQIFLAWFLFIPFTIIFYVSPEIWGHNESLLALHEIATLMIITGSVYLVHKIADEQELDSFGLKKDKWALTDFLVGFFVTFIVLGFSFLIYMWFGVIRITGFVWEQQSASYVFWYTVVTFLIFLFVGWSEELLSRGFHLQTIEKGTNRFWGVLISSLIFSYLHRNNPDMDTPGLIFIFFAGLMLAYAYLKTNQLWLSVGLHTGWDFFLVVVFFGIPIGRLRIFHLMEIDVYASSRLLVYGIQYLSLILCVLAIHIYSQRIRPKTQIK